MSDTFVPAGDKDTIIPRFYLKPVKDNFRSEQEGREIWNDVEYVEQIIPGDKHCVVDERVKDAHRERWPRQYDAFKKSQEVPVEGTPLEEWAGMSASQVLELKSCHIRTVEQLAELSDTQLAKSVPMGGTALRERAKKYVSQESDADRKIEALQAQVAALLAAAEAPKVIETEQAA